MVFGKTRCEYPITILFLVPGMVAGGAERQLIELVRNMDKSRFKAIIFCQKYAGEFFELAEESGAECELFGSMARFDPRLPLRLWKLIKSRSVDVIVTRGLSSYGMGTMLGSVAGVKAVIKAEHSTGETELGWGRRLLEKLLIPMTDCFIAVANRQVEFLVSEKRIPEDKIVVIYNGIDLDAFRPRPKSAVWLEKLDIPPGSEVVGILAVLRPEKDHENLLHAAARVIEEKSNTFFVLAGDGPERARLERLARDLGIADHLRFAGYVTDVAGVLSIFDLSVLCSYIIETLPMAFIEAMAMEKPLVATDVGGLAEMIDEGKNGYLVPKKDPDALAAAILEVLGSEDRIEKMGKYSRRLAEIRFSALGMTAATETLIEDLVCRG
jgi:glycosyltransferase involved in cell wall biosynthesis